MMANRDMGTGYTVGQQNRYRELHILSQCGGEMVNVTSWATNSLGSDLYTPERYNAMGVLQILWVHWTLYVL